jgi:uncharacterized peroxidase-related enzyme
MESHAEFLRLVTLDDSLIEALRADWRSAALAPEERAMLEYVEKLTLTPARVQREDVEALRAAGFDDRGILQIAQITSFFAYFNRMADGLGVGRP